MKMCPGTWNWEKLLCAIHVWHRALLNMSQRLKKGRETALNWQMSLVHCLRWPGFVLGGWADRSQNRFWWRCRHTEQCWVKPGHSGKSKGNGVALELPLMSEQMRSYQNVIDFSESFSAKQQSPYPHLSLQEKGKWVVYCLKLGPCWNLDMAMVETIFGMEHNFWKILLLFWIQKIF